MLGSLTWIVDPIDGTTNFVRGIPFWCLSAGLAIDGVPAVGVIYDPCRDEMFSAHAGGGALLNGAPMAVSSTSEPTRAILSLGFSFKSPMDRHNKVIAGLLSAGAVYRMHGAAPSRWPMSRQAVWTDSGKPSSTHGTLGLVWSGCRGWWRSERLPRQ